METKTWSAQMTARVVTYERSGDQRKIDCNTRTGWQLGSSAHLIRRRAASDDGDDDAGDGFLFSFFSSSI